MLGFLLSNRKTCWRGDGGRIISIKWQRRNKWKWRQVVGSPPPPSNPLPLVVTRHSKPGIVHVCYVKIIFSFHLLFSYLLFEFCFLEKFTCKFPVQNIRFRMTINMRIFCFFLIKYFDTKQEYLYNVIGKAIHSPKIVFLPFLWFVLPLNDDDNDDDGWQWFGHGMTGTTRGQSRRGHWQTERMRRGRERETCLRCERGSWCLVCGFVMSNLKKFLKTLSCNCQLSHLRGCTLQLCFSVFESFAV